MKVAFDSGDLTFKERSIFKLLNGSMDNGIVQEVGLVRSSKTYARIISWRTGEHDGRL